MLLGDDLRGFPGTCESGLRESGNIAAFDPTVFQVPTGEHKQAFLEQLSQRASWVGFDQSSHARG